MPGPAQCRSASAHLQSPLSVTLYLASSVSLPLLRPTALSSPFNFISHSLAGAHAAGTRACVSRI
jgi:hypothetical protein